MRPQSPNAKEQRFYFALAQVGTESVVPMILGLFLDYHFGWTPWATVVGFILGFVGGFTHMLMMLKHHEAQGGSRPPGEGK